MSGSIWASIRGCSPSSRRKRGTGKRTGARGRGVRPLEQVELRCSLPFLHRLRGNILLKHEPANPAPAEEAFKTAIAIATEQSARSPRLQAALSLAKLYRSTGRAAEAHDVLAPALEGFSPTPEMPEIAEAQSLLAALSETEEVKAGAVRRQQRQRLRVAYGNALFATRGPGAPETTEAFARARERADSNKDAPERLAADFGLWAGSYVRGEHAAMKAHATAFLSDVEANPDSPEAGVAHRCAGGTHWFAAEYGEARDHLERAVALFQPGRDDDWRTALERTRALSNAVPRAHIVAAGRYWPRDFLAWRREARISGLAHLGTRAYGQCARGYVRTDARDLSRAELHMPSNLPD